VNNGGTALKAEALAKRRLGLHELLGAIGSDK
jgi:hypothetical protein